MFTKEAGICGHCPLEGRYTPGIIPYQCRDFLPGTMYNTRAQTAWMEIGPTLRCPV